MPIFMGVLVVSTAVALALAGCGGPTEGATLATPTSPGSKAAWVFLEDNTANPTEVGPTQPVTARPPRDKSIINLTVPLAAAQRQSDSIADAAKLMAYNKSQVQPARLRGASARVLRVEAEAYGDFFVATGGVAGALIGLLFVAVSVSQERFSAKRDGALYRVRATAALTSFTNALVISLFGLIPHSNMRNVSSAVATAGLVSVLAMLMSLMRARALRADKLWDLVFLAGLSTLFVFQVVIGFHSDENLTSDLDTLATLLVMCFLVGIARSWELIGGPSIRVSGEIGGMGRDFKERRRDGDHRL